MPTIKHDAFFRRHPVFTGEELAEHLSAGDGTGAGARTRESLVAYHTRTGRLVRVRRGLFAVIPHGSDGEDYPIDPFLVASKLTPDAVLSHHTALEFHGRAYSVWRHLTYLASRPLEPLTFRHHVYRGARFPEALVRAGKEQFGVSTPERSGMSLRVTSLERTLVDVLDRPHVSGGWEEIWRSLETVEFFDLDRVVEYVLLLGKATAASKVGYYLEEHRESLMVEEGHLKALRSRRPRQPHYVDRKRRGNASLVAAWNLVVPTEVVERSWAEVT